MSGKALSQRRDPVQGLEIFTRFSQRSEPLGRPPLVLVHGLSMSSLYLLPTAARLAQRYPQVYAPDLPGYGKSEKTKKIFTIEELAAFLDAWLDQLGLGEVLMVGNSLGTEIIVEHALQFPGRACKVVLTSLTPDPAHRSFTQHFFRLAVAFLREPPSLIPVIVKDYLSAGMRRTLQTAHYSLSDPIQDKLPDVHVPALVVRGSRDPIVSQAWAEQAARLLPFGRLLIIPGGGHAVNWSYARQLCQAIEVFEAERPG